MCFVRKFAHRSTNSLAESLDILSQYCSEFLVHAADVEGLCQGIDEDLVRSTQLTPYLKHALMRFP